MSTPEPKPAQAKPSKPIASLSLGVAPVTHKATSPTAPASIPTTTPALQPVSPQPVISQPVAGKPVVGEPNLRAPLTPAIHLTPQEKEVYDYLDQANGARLTEIESTLGFNRLQSVDALRALIHKGLVTQTDRTYSTTTL